MDKESLFKNYIKDIIARTNFLFMGPPYKHSFSDAILIALRAVGKITLLVTFTTRS